MTRDSKILTGLLVGFVVLFMMNRKGMIGTRSQGSRSPDESDFDPSVIIPEDVTGAEIIDDKMGAFGRVRGRNGFGGSRQGVNDAKCGMPVGKCTPSCDNAGGTVENIGGDDWCTNMNSPFVAIGGGRPTLAQNKFF